VPSLVDTNVLVYRFDPRFPEKQRVASALLRAGLERGDTYLCHQVLVEFVAATTRARPNGRPLLRPEEAWREATALLAQFPVLSPKAEDLQLALRGCAAYDLSWFDALIWAVAENNGLGVLWTEDLQAGRRYGRVRVQNPFLG
jgi:predicted nucleic acid-binding protein